MYIFLITFLLLYGGIHFYAFLKVKAAFSFTPEAGIYIALFMLIMVFAPFIALVTERPGLGFFSRIMSYIGYMWMGILFLFFSGSIAVDIYHTLIYSAGLILRKDLISLIPSARHSFYIPLVMSISIGIYGYFEALNIRTEKVEIKTSKIPEEISRLRIVQISDVHLGMIVREQRLKRIIDRVKEAKPDILVSTGDLVDGQIYDIEGFAELFKEIKPMYGKFAVTGNHEFYAGLGKAMDFTERAGFKLLRGRGVTVAGMINIAGVDDPAGAGMISIAGVDDPSEERYGIYREVPEGKLLSDMPPDKFTILLKHRPVVDKNALGLFDLQLSGHTHKGQIFPFSLITWLYYMHTIQAGYLRLVDDSYLYVSRGAGTWGPPIRFLSPPEVTVIELVNEG